MDTSITMPTLIAKSVLLDEDAVRILDRRVFPFKTEFVVCRTVEEVAVAIEDMVTQSSGPFFAASAGFVLAAREAAKLRSEARLAFLAEAGARLVRTRPTNNNIRDIIASLFAEAESIIGNDDIAELVEELVRAAWDKQHENSRQLGENAAQVLSDGDTILTHCWGESGIIHTLDAAQRANKKLKFICTETRPYLQGARLTAHSVAEMGAEVTVITDGMAAHAMHQGMVSKLMTAADRVTMSGHVVNKVGTLQLAIAASHFYIPFLACVRFPDPKALTPADVHMEERDAEESLHCLGIRTASPLAKGWYPAFDITPPNLVSAVATCLGVFAPLSIHQRFAGSGSV